MRLFFFKIIASLLFLSTASKAEAQSIKNDGEDFGRLIQFSGVIMQGDSLSPVPYVHILNTKLGNGTVSDLFGFFSIVARPGDSLKFSAIGFKRSYYHIPDTLSSTKYSIFHILSEDTIMLAPSYIYPWPSKELFADAFVKTEIPNDDLQRAKKNLELAALREQMQYMPMDGSLNYKWSMQQHQQKLYYAGQAPPLQIANVFAWSQFIKAWREGKLKNPEKKFDKFEE